MDLDKLATHLRTVRGELMQQGRNSLADSVLKALAEIEQIEFVRQELERDDCLGM